MNHDKFVKIFTFKRYPNTYFNHMILGGWFIQKRPWEVIIITILRIYLTILVLNSPILYIVHSPRDHDFD